MGGVYEQEIIYSQIQFITSSITSSITNSITNLHRYRSATAACSAVSRSSFKKEDKIFTCKDP